MASTNMALKQQIWLYGAKAQSQGTIPLFFIWRLSPLSPSTSTHLKAAVQQHAEGGRFAVV